MICQILVYVSGEVGCKTIGRSRIRLWLQSAYYHSEVITGPGMGSGGVQMRDEVLTSG